MAEFNTTPQSYDAEAFSTAERLAFLTSWGAALVNGSSAQDFTAKSLNITGSTEGIILNDLSGGSNEGLAILWQNASKPEQCSLRQFSRITGSEMRFFTNATNSAGNLVQRLKIDENMALFSANVTAQSFTPFTGCHVVPNEGQNFKIGELICIEAIGSEDKKQPDWRGRYAKKGENGIFGIVFGENEEPKPIPEIGMNKFYLVACLGDMKVLCNGENGNIEYGDELCASSIEGQAMKADEDIHRRKVCGIAGRSYTFTGDEVILMDTTKE